MDIEEVSPIPAAFLHIITLTSWFLPLGAVYSWGLVVNSPQHCLYVGVLSRTLATHPVVVGTLFI